MKEPGGDPKGNESTQDLYPINPTPEQRKLNRVYHVIQEWYKRTMFEAPPQWVGYSSFLGFDIPAETFGFAEPSLQRILSLLHAELANKKASINDVTEKLKIVIGALEKFDPEKDVASSSLDDFNRTNAKEHIVKVKNALKKVLSEVSRDLESVLGVEGTDASSPELADAF